LLKEERKKKKNRRKTQQHRQGLLLGLADLVPDYWLEVCLLPDGLATGQLD
jgi:hypothetical protein